MEENKCYSIDKGIDANKLKLYFRINCATIEFETEQKTSTHL